MSQYEIPDTTLRGRWLIAAWVAWIPIVALALVMYIVIEGFALVGPAETQGKVILLVVDVGYLVFFGATAFMILWRRHDDWVALLVTLAMVSIPLSFTEPQEPAFLATNPGWIIPLTIRNLSIVPSILLLFFVFPNGRFVPRWAGAIVLLMIPVTFIVTDLPLLRDSTAHYKSGVDDIIFMGIVVFGLISQVYRYRRVSSPTERQQTKWVIVGLLGIFSGILVWTIGTFALPPLSDTAGPIDALGDTSFGTFGLPFEIGAGVLMFVLPMGLPLSLMFAILRYRLWDTDVVINRALVYGVLTATLVGIYFGGVVLLQMAFRAVTDQGSSVAIVISTLTIAALFMPLRRGVQNIMDRRFYRRKYDAARTLEAFTATARDEVDIEKLTKELVAVVQETVQPAQVSLWLRSADDSARRRSSETLEIT